MAATSITVIGDRAANGQITESDSNSTLPSSSVLTTYELVEAIILTLPAENILLAVGVNPVWWSVVTTSKAVYERLQEIRRSLWDQSRYPYPGVKVKQPCFILIHVGPFKILIRRIYDFEIIALLPDPYMSTPASPHPTIMDGKHVTIKMTPFYDDGKQRDRRAPATAKTSGQNA
jgi:hypothetical protein